jgi:hypothetical protein
MAELQACGATLDEVIPKSKIKYQPNALDKESYRVQRTRERGSSNAHSASYYLHYAFKESQWGKFFNNAVIYWGWATSK